jgi:hypothetical protein
VQFLQTEKRSKAGHKKQVTKGADNRPFLRLFEIFLNLLQTKHRKRPPLLHLQHVVAYVRILKIILDIMLK